MKVNQSGDNLFIVDHRITNDKVPYFFPKCSTLFISILVYSMTLKNYHVTCG